MAVTARRPFVLYADRRRAHPPFSDVERRFARALVERIGREDELWTRPGLAPAPAAALETDVGIVGRSPAMVRLASEIRAYAAFDLPVYLAGESGTGKELVASAIHRLGARQRRPFVALNCAALPEPLFESELFGHVRGAFTGASGDRDGILTRADGGILFLDEVGELTLPMQAKLLRVVELGEYRPVGTSSSRKVDVRFLSATNRHLENEVAAARFREDLYYRLMATARIDLPPLRERTGDVALLLGHFLAREALRHRVAELTVAPEALAALERHPYPGNVRELERLVAGLYARCAGRRIELGDLPSPVRGAGRIVGAMRDRSSLRTARLDFERHYLKGLLERHGGNRTHAARAAGVARQTLVAMLKRHRVEAEEGPPPGAPPPGGGLRIGPEAG
jgi:DNA-binding NtrC family response regulator